MARMKKKGTTGAAKNYITRSQALKRLQVTLADFRRLCILKGIFPRQPRNVKKANKGSTAPASFYYARDIAYLQHEPVLQSLREYKTFAKKLSRAIGRREWEMAKGLDERKPVYRLDHIIKERYPTFDDSLKDVDDALSLLMLFANLPSNTTVSPETIQSCARLCAQWQLYVMHARALRKVFLSIKGIYFQAEIRGQRITWLVPYMFTQHIPHDIDFRIMSTFLELYQTLMGFILFKLYSDINLVYPPQMNEGDDEQGAGVGAFRLTEAAKAALDGLSGEGEGGAKGRERISAKIDKSSGKKVTVRDVRREIKAVNESDLTEEQADNDVAGFNAPQQAETERDEFVERPSKADEATNTAPLVTLADLDATASNSVQQTLFAPYYFYISRECPRSVIEFVLRSFGASAAQIGWDEVSGAGSAFKEDDPRITHHVIDRPVVNKERHTSGKRVYVQPQWVIDCVNLKKILGASLYAPGQTLPPHLSPFVDNEEIQRRGGYVPAEAAIGGVSTNVVVNDESDSEEEVEEGEERSEDAGSKSARPAMSALLADPLNDDLVASAELEAEANGGEAGLQDLHDAHAVARKAAIKRSSKASSGKADQPVSEDAEAKAMTKMLMSNRQRKLYNKLSYTEGKRGEEKRKLTAKKQKLVKNANRKGRQSA
jgi:pescadillo protein